MWIDVIMEIHHKSYEVLRLTSRFQLRFYVRIITLMLLLADEVIVYAIPDWTIRPFLILRCCNYIFICSAPHFLRLQCQEGFLSAVVSLQGCACIFVLLYLRHCWVRYCCQPNYTTSRRCWLRPTIEQLSRARQNNIHTLRYVFLWRISRQSVGSNSAISMDIWFLHMFYLLECVLFRDDTSDNSVQLIPIDPF